MRKLTKANSNKARVGRKKGPNRLITWGIPLLFALALFFFSWYGMYTFFTTYGFQTPIVIRFQPIMYKKERGEPTRKETKDVKQEQEKRTKEVLSKQKEEQAKEKHANLKGEASYYSFEGCVGCDEQRIMANGEQLDDSKLTLALTPNTVGTYKLLNKTVTVKNVATGKEVKAKVTDTGGFGALGRVADLSVATRDAIGCSSLCQVEIYF